MSSAATLVDAHVHLYRAYDLGDVFSAAKRNLQISSNPLAEQTRCLCLTEDRSHDVFLELPGFSDSNWTVEHHPDGQTMRARERSTDTSIWIFAGRQIVTAERLEVLALLSHPNHRAELQDGESLAATVEKIHSVGALPVLPWAFGKWWFARGKIVTEFLAQTALPVFLGDNGGRCPRLGGLNPIDLAKKVGRPLLPGSDPLPFRAQEKRVGRSGFRLDLRMDENAPAASLHGALSSLVESPAAIGTRASFTEFVESQWSLRTKKFPPLAGQ